MEAISLHIHWFSLLISCALALAAVAFISAYGFICRRAALPPGPRGLPIIGHLHMLGSLPHHTLARLSNIHGPLMSLRFGSLPVLVASSPDMAKLILHTHDKIFSDRPQNLSIPKIAFNSLDIAFSTSGPYWKLMRQLCFTEFFCAKRHDSFQPMREEEVCSLMRSILAAQGAPVSIREKLYTTNSNIISRMTIGARLQELIGTGSKSVPSLLELFMMMGVFNVSDYMPWLAWMDLQGLGRRSKKAARIANSMFQEVIDRRRASRSSDDPPHDFLDVLLMASLTSQLEIGDQHIRAVLMDMFAAGIDTPTVITEWALAELFANPDKLAIVRKEIEDVVGCSRLIRESDIPNLPYLRAMTNETFRLHPTGAFLLPRISMESCKISTYHIQKNTLVYVNAWAIYKDPKIWNKPLEFSPERFLDINIDALTQKCKFLPFGAGRRNCPAYKQGFVNVQIVLGNLVHAFDWQSLSKPHMSERPGIVTTLKDPLVIVPMPRLPNSLFE